MENDRYENRKLFRKYFGLEDDEYYSNLSKLWMIFGNNGIKHTAGGHYFIQEIIEHNIVCWGIWKNKLHPDLIKIIKDEYPQLMTTNKKYDLK